MSLWTHEHSTANTGSMADYAAPTLRKKANRRKEKSRAPVLKTAELLKNLQLGGSSIGRHSPSSLSARKPSLT